MSSVFVLASCLDITHYQWNLGPLEDILECSNYKHTSVVWFYYRYENALTFRCFSKGANKEN